MPNPSVFRPVCSDNIRIEQFKVHKNWTVKNTEYSGSGNALYHAVHVRDPIPVGDPKAVRAVTNSFDGTYQGTIWKALDHAYYRHAYDPARTLESDQSDIRKIEKFLFISASTLTFPYLKMGSKIKPGSLTLNETAGNYALQDDGNGNMRDNDISTGSFATSSALVAYWGFNNEFRKFKTAYGVSSIPSIIKFESNTFQPTINSDAYNIDFGPGIKCTGEVTYANNYSGIRAHFNNSGSELGPGTDTNRRISYIKTDTFDEINFRRLDEFAISVWVNLPVSQSITNKLHNYIISKRGVEDTTKYNKKVNATEPFFKQKEINKVRYRYPYQLSVYNQSAGTEFNGKLRFRRSDGTRIVNFTSSICATGSDTHVLIQKTGSLIEMYINGTLDSSGSDVISSNVHNTSKLIFGSINKSGSFGLSGSIDEVRFYNEALPQDAITSLANNHILSSSAYQTNVAGNIFYKLGQMVVTSPLPKYFGAMTGSWNALYKSTHTITENEIFIQVPKDTFNVSTNPTATYRMPTKPTKLGGLDKTLNGPGEFIKPEFTASLRPYITSIGLYNDNAQLIAVAKLAQPIFKRDDIDLNFIVRWDT